jgi:YgiT-type zinc finger domain-containing protein
MARSAALQWGRCPCGGQYENRLVEIKLTVEGKKLVLRDIPQGACPSCGSRVYKAETLARIEGVMKNEKLDRRLSSHRD